ncbi:MAG: diaminopimelate decarboxylase [bacterium]|nr:diaminopimelate decarboxylase [bacterium]
MSINQSTKPVTTIRNGNLQIGGCNLVELAKQYGTPLYVMDEQTIRGICREYKQSFSNCKNIVMTYASKALCNMTIAKIIAQEGFGFDAVSAGELYVLNKAGVNMKKVTFNGNNKTEEEIDIALSYGIGLFSVDNFHEAELLNKLSASKGIVTDILIRITPGIECHTHDYIKTGQINSKFGFDLSQTEKIVELIVKEYKNLNLKGLHAHVGSQIFESECYKDEIDVLVRELANINSKFGLNMSILNIGGGLGVKYTEDDTPLSVEKFSNAIADGLSTAQIKYNIRDLTLFIEPGRSIVSTAGVTLYTIGSSKITSDGKKYIAVDGGMADNPRPSMYQAKYSAEIANDTAGRIEQTVTIAGRYCESGDILINDILLPEVFAGDILCVFNTGAYNRSMASNYNQTRKPAMVLVNNSQSDMIVNRESFEDLIALEKVPDRLSK